MGGLFKWPSVHDVLVYRNEVRQLVLDVIDKTPLELPVTEDSPWVVDNSYCTITTKVKYLY